MPTGLWCGRQSMTNLFRRTVRPLAFRDGSERIIGGEVNICTGEREMEGGKARESFGCRSLSLPCKKFARLSREEKKEGGWKEGETGKGGVCNFGRGIFNECRSLQVTSSPPSSPLSHIFSPSAREWKREREAHLVGLNSRLAH